MQATYEYMTAPALQALVEEGTLARDWGLDPWHMACSVRSAGMPPLLQARRTRDMNDSITVKGNPRLRVVRLDQPDGNNERMPRTWNLNSSHGAQRKCFAHTPNRRSE
jgi:hypothetical protein